MWHQQRQHTAAIPSAGTDHILQSIVESGQILTDFVEPGAGAEAAAGVVVDTAPRRGGGARGRGARGAGRAKGEGATGRGAEEEQEKVPERRGEEQGVAEKHEQRRVVVRGHSECTLDVP